ncbi:MAG: hypothetical protein HZR80_02940 [Candidatus Heimdallarchaeota archaeon]
MKRNENRCKRRRYSVSSLLKLLFISSLFLFVSLNNTTIMGEGIFLIDEVNTPLLKEEWESGYVLCEQDGYLYLWVDNYTQDVGHRNIVQIIDIQQPESPVVVGRYVLDPADWIMDFEISENIAYLLIERATLCVERFLVALLDISDPTNPVLLGKSALLSITNRVESSIQINRYKNYTYVSSDELLIFDCSNQTSPVIVANYTSSGGELHVINDFFYLVSAGVKIFDLTDPVNPVLLGEVNSTKHNSARSGVYGNYVINTFLESGIQVYNCADHFHPTICWDYDFPDQEFQVEGIIHDMEIVGDRLFAGGRNLSIFDISDPHKLKRIARISIGDQIFNRITVANNYMYLTFPSSIRIYSYIENTLVLNFGLGIGIGLPIVIVGSLLIRRKKKKS